MSLTVRGLTARYGGSAVVRGVSIELNPGQVTAMIGANGVGKSTLLRSIAGLHRQASGSVTLDGRELLGRPAHRIARDGLALVPEGRHLFTDLTVRENLTMGLNGLSCPAREAQNRIEEVFTMFPILAEFAGRPAGALSGGQQQMLAIGRSLVRRPRVLLLDEPSLGLAPLLVQQILSVARARADDGVAVLLAEQNAAAALRVADTGAIMENGVLTRVDDAAALLADDDVSRHYLGAGGEIGQPTGSIGTLPDVLKTRTL
ncbi:MAG TPA: ABC transporter ATP-binding protein [Actinoallomurus sp.]|jgi:branched-chain amino acid transport system ATP-binding protein|nr:ABC transporter ATP-binding protein [Actinoallomurus sp.]